LVGGATAAWAFSYQTMPADVAAAYALHALACGGKVDGHNALIAKARAALDGEIAQGLKPAGAQEIVVCPICGCRMVVSPGATL
jgi:hypothetical protein